MQYFWDRLCVRVFWGAASLLLIGCSGDKSTPLARNPAAVTLSGTILDGPVVDADLEITDAIGEVVARGSSGAAADFRLIVPPNTAYPITLRSRAGTDLVTHAAPDIPLELIIADPSQTIGNVSSLSTLAARIATCAAVTPDSERVERAWAQVLEQLAMGYDANRFGDPRSVPLDAVNVAALAIASEGLAETVRRTANALSTTSDALGASELIDAIACDFGSDSLVDGRGGVAVSQRVAAAFSAASAGVLVEIATGQLHVGGADATLEMDRAIAAMIPDAGAEATVGDVPLTGALLRQAREALIRVHVGLEDDRVVQLVAMLDQVPLAALPDALARALTPDELAALTDLPRRISVADDATLARANAAAPKIGGALPPLISFAASPAQVPLGGAARLSWAAVNAARCWASGDWSGVRNGEGTLLTPPLNRTVTYRLDCTGLGGTATSAVSANVAGAPAAPTVALAATSATVARGANVGLTWSTTGADTCEASDAWSGVQAVAGTHSVGPIVGTNRFVLTCTGRGGRSSNAVTVAVATTGVPRPPPRPPATPPPAPTPVPVSASLAATPMWLAPGASTTLTWSSTGATQCAGAGGWSGNKPLSGSVTLGPIASDTTFSLSCGGGMGTALATTTVSTRTARLTWQAPANIVDPATIAGFRIDYGNAPGNYNAGVSIANGSMRSTTLTLSPGTYYFGMRALDDTGSEIARSNEASKTIR